MIGIDIDDRDVMRKLKELERKVKQIDGEHKVSFEELFPPHFMKKYTDADNFTEFLQNSSLIPIDAETINQEMFEAIPDDKFDQYIQKHTAFGSWEFMMSTATKEWTAKKLGF